MWYIYLPSSSSSVLCTPWGPLLQSLISCSRMETYVALAPPGLVLLYSSLVDLVTLPLEDLGAVSPPCHFPCFLRVADKVL